MNNLIIWDLDGVLIDSRDLHYHSLNSALSNIGEQYVISREEHLSIYDGLNTTKKLDMLTERKGLPKSAHNKVWQDKQTATFDLIKRFSISPKAIQACQEIKKRGWKIAIASNSIRETVKLALISIGIMEYVDVFISNEDVARTKPYPEMYWKAMTLLNALPKNTIIIEDSHIGRQGALDSGANLLPVENADSWVLNDILNKIKEVESKTMENIPWINKKLNVIIPMSGDGSRFANTGKYSFPKPLIEIRKGDQNMPMIEMVVRNLNIQANYIFIVKKEHYEQYDLENVLNRIAPNCKIIQVEHKTEGAACSILLAKEYIDNDAPLFVANSDQFVPHGEGGWNSNEVLYSFGADTVDGGIVCFNASHPKWSYVRLDDNGFVSEVAEKKVISDIATIGFYYWTKGSDFVWSAEQMIAKDIRVNNEYYLVPTYQELIDAGKKIKIKMVNAPYGTGTPEDLDYFLENYTGKI